MNREARSVVEILGNDSLFYRMKRQAYEYGRSMIWPKVGRTYWKLLREHVAAMPIRLMPSVDLRDWTRTSLRSGASMSIRTDVRDSLREACLPARGGSVAVPAQI